MSEDLIYERKYITLKRWYSKKFRLFSQIRLFIRTPDKRSWLICNYDQSTDIWDNWEKFRVVKWEYLDRRTAAVMVEEIEDAEEN